VSLPESISDSNVPAGYTIGLARCEHIEAIAGIELAAASIFSESDLPLDIRYRVSAADVMLEAQRAGRLWIALHHDRQPVGFAQLEILDGLAHLVEVDVHPNHARQGVGSALLQATIDWARHKEYAAMTLVTFGHLSWNAPFYEKFGFVNVRPEQMSNTLHDLIRHEAAEGLNIQNRVAMQLSLIL